MLRTHGKLSCLLNSQVAANGGWLCSEQSKQNCLCGVVIQQAYVDSPSPSSLFACALLVMPLFVTPITFSHTVLPLPRTVLRCSFPCHLLSCLPHYHTITHTQLLWRATSSALRLYLSHTAKPPPQHVHAGGPTTTASGASAAATTATASAAAVSASAAGATHTHTVLLRDIPGVPRGTFLDQVGAGILFFIFYFLGVGRAKVEGGRMKGWGFSGVQTIGLWLTVMCKGDTFLECRGARF